jgi:hypothetical protein
MIGEFPYRKMALRGAPAPTIPVTWLEAGASYCLRPVVRVSLTGEKRSPVMRALVDTGSVDTVFPQEVAETILAKPIQSGGKTWEGALFWRGAKHHLTFADVEIELEDVHGGIFRWTARVGFTSAPLRLPLLGYFGCLEYFDASFRGSPDNLLQLTPKTCFAGSAIAANSPDEAG